MRITIEGTARQAGAHRTHWLRAMGIGQAVRIGTGARHMARPRGYAVCHSSRCPLVAPLITVLCGLCGAPPYTADCASTSPSTTECR